MNDGDFDDEALASILDARAGRPAVEAAAERRVRDAAVLAALADLDLAREAAYEPPPLEDDPTALMLGLVVDPETSFDGKAAVQSRKRSSLSISQLAARLVGRGWSVSSQDVFAWEAGSRPVPPALARAIAEESGISPQALLRRAGTDPVREGLRAILRGPDFQRLAERWAALKGTSVAVAASALEARALAAVHRGGAPEPGVVMETLDALIRTLEGQDGGEER